jgi:hypothetical protein
MNRKHTRWKTPGSLVQSIRTFFHPKPD